MNQKNKPTKAQVKKERSLQKVRTVIKEKGYPSGKLPKDKELHHKKPVSEGGKTTQKNTQVLSKEKHKEIHRSRRRRGKV